MRLQRSTLRCADIFARFKRQRLISKQVRHADGHPRSSPPIFLLARSLTHPIVTQSDTDSDWHCITILSFLPPPIHLSSFFLFLSFFSVFFPISTGSCRRWAGAIKSGRRSSYLLAITAERSKSCDEGLNAFRDDGRVFS